MILDVCVKAKIPNSIVSELSLCILTDMQWDVAFGYNSYYGYNESNAVDSTNTIIEKTREAFAKAGNQAVGEPYKMPKIIVWNLRGNIDNFAADSSCEGIEMLGGWSQALLKLFLAGETLEAVADPEKPKPTPYDTYRKAMDDQRYDDIRLYLSDIDEIPFNNYHFEKKSDEPCIQDDV